jgi:hypothetical protein
MNVEWLTWNKQVTASSNIRTHACTRLAGSTSTFFVGQRLEATTGPRLASKNVLSYFLRQASIFKKKTF